GRPSPRARSRCRPRPERSRASGTAAARRLPVRRARPDAADASPGTGESAVPGPDTPSRSWERSRPAFGYAARSASIGSTDAETEPPAHAGGSCGEAGCYLLTSMLVLGPAGPGRLTPSGFSTTSLTHSVSPSL